jgi:hypothetical protein
MAVSLTNSNDEASGISSLCRKIGSNFTKSIKRRGAPGA